MEISLSLIGLFDKVFGVPGDAFDPLPGAVVGNVVGKRSESGVYGSPFYGKDAKGREYYMPVTVEYTNSEGRQVTLDLPTPVVSIRNDKHVVETELTERRGKVSELISTNNWRISVKGFCIDSSGNELPEEQLIALRDLFECDVPFSIKSPLTDIYLLRPDRQGSDQVTIRGYDVPYSVGVKHVKAYTLELVSDEPFNLIQLSGS